MSGPEAPETHKTFDKQFFLKYIYKLSLRKISHLQSR
jgi:hypothetical protein